MEKNKKPIAEEFHIDNFINKEKEHANRWANQHRWRNGGRHLSEALRIFLKKRAKNDKKT